ncbi:MAG: tRNA guanosine(34) transglycosylase Tgt [Candidatus Omnitrophica bacterium]|nr:tRNA guanosine(34) transglycosylase Tgt [Candidatus Omnitrophota bacterium]
MQIKKSKKTELAKVLEGGFEFKILHTDTTTRARVGLCKTAHGMFETPVFMPVATQGTVKALSPRDLNDIGTEIILANAYHLYIRPGIDIIKQFHGLHHFMGWPGPILTDSGGYQVFSLSRLRRISEEGVCFASYFDGDEIFLTPEKVIEIQEAMDSDIAMVFDDCPLPTKDRKRIKESLGLTLRWSERAKRRHRLRSQALFGIVQGGIFEDLRRESLEKTVEMDFDGYALGGLCVGEPKEDTLRILDTIMPAMPEAKPRYLMGVGTPLDFLEAIERGADLFDCVNPTRYGRNGTAFTRSGLIVVRNGKYQRDPEPIDSACGCYTCRHFSRAYLRHLLNAGEMLGPQLLSFHNVYFFVNFVKTIRDKIQQGKFSDFKKDFMNHFDPDCR